MRKNDKPNGHESIEDCSEVRLENSSVRFRPGAMKELPEDERARTSLSRRTILGALLAIAGVAVWQSRENIPDMIETPPSNGTETGQTPTGGSTGMTSPWEQEQALRQQQQRQEFPLVPSFASERVTAEAPESESQVMEITVAPASSASGDRTLVITESGVGNEIADLLTAMWTYTDQEGTNYERTIDGSTLQFSIHEGTEVTVATAVQSLPETDGQEELYIVRAESESTVRNLIDGFEELYTSDT